jgi:hypothetical protein
VNLESALSEDLRRRGAAAHLGMRRLAGSLQKELVQGAPWQDRTTHARNGLRAGFTVLGLSGDLGVLELAHGVEYGVFLEKRNAGTYSIVDRLADETTLRPRIDRVLDAAYGGPGAV